MRKRLRGLLLLAALVFFAIIMLDSQGVFDKRPYRGISHGSHVHYVPRDWDGSVSVSDFPQRPPGPCEQIMPQGQFARIPDCQP